MYGSVPPHAYAETWRHREYLHTRWQAGAFRPVRNFDPYGARKTQTRKAPKHAIANVQQATIARAPKFAPLPVTRSHHASAFAFLPVLSMVEK